MALLGSLFPGANTTNPTTSTVLVTTGNLNAGYYMFYGVFACSVAAGFNYEILDAADSVVQTVVIRTPAANTVTVYLGYIPIGTNYEVRVRPLANITGQASASIVASVGAIA